MLLYHPRGDLWLGERFGEPGVWQFPQGGVDAGSTLYDNVLRELEEELGITTKELGKITPLTARHEYFFSKPRAYGKEIFAGQSQTFWAVEFVGPDSAFKLDGHDQEFAAWQWCALGSVLDIVEPKRRPGYVAPVNEISRLVSAQAKMASS